MLMNYNTQSQQSVPAPSPVQGPPAAWPDWLQHIATLISHAVPDDERIAFLADLVQSAADEARLNGLTDVLSHRRWYMDVSTDGEPAAPYPIDEADIPW